MACDDPDSNPDSDCNDVVEQEEGEDSTEEGSGPDGPLLIAKPFNGEAVEVGEMSPTWLQRRKVVTA
jgi:hypothetical protein